MEDAIQIIGYRDYQEMKRVAEIREEWFHWQVIALDGGERGGGGGGEKENEKKQKEKGRNIRKRKGRERTRKRRKTRNGLGPKLLLWKSKLSNLGSFNLLRCKTHWKQYTKCMTTVPYDLKLQIIF